MVSSSEWTHTSSCNLFCSARENALTILAGIPVGGHKLSWCNFCSELFISSSYSVSARTPNESFLQKVCGDAKTQWTRVLVCLLQMKTSWKHDSDYIDFCVHLLATKPCESVTFSKRRFRGILESMCHVILFHIYYVLCHALKELIERCQSKVHVPCPIGIVHSFGLLKGKFPQHRFRYANEFVERYWKTTKEFR